MKFNGINDDTIRGQRFSQTGAKFAYTDAATITMSGAGSDSKAVVIVKSSTDTLSVVVAADLTCALSTSGAGGLDTGSEASDTGYYVFLITKPFGKLPALLYSLSPTGPTMPSGYTYRSDPIWFISNDGSSNIIPFIDVNGGCFYTDPVTLGTDLFGYSAWTLVDCSPAAPDNSTMFIYGYSTSKSTSTWNKIRLHTNDSDAINANYESFRFKDVIRSANGAPGAPACLDFPLIDASAGLYYQWQIDPGSGGSNPPRFSLYCRGWALS